MSRILVVGGGAIGGITAAQADADVVVLDANEAHVAALRDPGLVYEEEGSERTAVLNAVASIDELEGEFDYALVAVKSPLHHVALEPLVARGGIGAFVSMGNGLIQDRMQSIVGEGNLLACIVEWGGSNVGPGHLIRDSLGGYMVGELDGTISERVKTLAAALEPVGRTRVTDNVRGMIWSKLLINTTFTGLQRVSGLRYGGVGEQGPDAVFALWAEGVAVGDAQGLALERIHDVEAHRVRAGRPGDDDAPYVQRAPLDAAGPRRGARHRGRRRQRGRGRQGARARHRHAVQ